MASRCHWTASANCPNSACAMAIVSATAVVLRFSASDLLDAIRTLAIGLADSNVAGKLWIVQRGRIREYHQEPSDA